MSDPGMPPLGSLCPLLQVYDMPTSLRFYRDVLGFTIVEQSSPGDECDWVWLRSGQASLMLNTRYEAGDRPPARDSVREESHDDVGLFIEAHDLDAIYRHLQAHGIPADAPVTQAYGMRQLYTRDPDRFGLCFQHPAPYQGAMRSTAKAAPQEQ